MCALCMTKLMSLIWRDLTGKERQTSCILLEDFEMCKRISSACTLYIYHL